MNEYLFCKILKGSYYVIYMKELNIIYFQILVLFIYYKYIYHGLNLNLRFNDYVLWFSSSGYGLYLGVVGGVEVLYYFDDMK